ncbi:MAG TPA: flagellar biosynthesis anti-sigma factor FlgM [Tissierellia bacterium]|nr:flagellar biosynthesis anti-sigma factor FlgM [Tissierellia bacterium]
MKIQNINNYMSYKSNLKAVKNEEVNISKKYDVVEIKSRNGKNDNFSLNSIKKNIVSKISEDTSAEKINKIKDSIKNNTYRIDAEEIVKKMLK